MVRSGAAVLFCALFAACGGAVEGDLPGADAGDAEASGGASGSSATGGFGNYGAVGGYGGYGGYAGYGGEPADAGWDGWVDPGCPDAEPIPPDYQCDAFHEPSGCSSGEGCYPWVQYPAMPCDQETYGTLCSPVGTGQQGDACGGQMCAGGFVCVVTGQGTQCVRLCELTGPDTCPPGLFCVPVDVEGFGGCF